MAKWRIAGAAGFIDDNDMFPYSLSPVPPESFLKQICAGLNLTDLIEHPVTPSDAVDDTELSMIKFGVLTALKAKPKNPMLLDFLRVIKRAELK